MPMTSSLYNVFPEELTVEMVHTPAGPASRLFGGGISRMWTLQRSGGRGRPSFKGLEDMLTERMAVGQALILDAATPGELAQYIGEVKKIMRRRGVTVRWDGQERVWVASGAYEWQRVYRHRAYLVLTARISGSGFMANDRGTKVS
jgi:hypothetical protein